MSEKSFVIASLRLMPTSCSQSGTVVPLWLQDLSVSAELWNSRSGGTAVLSHRNTIYKPESADLITPSASNVEEILHGIMVEIEVPVTPTP